MYTTPRHATARPAPAPIRRGTVAAALTIHRSETGEQEEPPPQCRRLAAEMVEELAHDLAALHLHPGARQLGGQVGGRVVSGPHLVPQRVVVGEAGCAFGGPHGVVEVEQQSVPA